MRQASTIRPPTDAVTPTRTSAAGAVMPTDMTTGECVFDTIKPGPVPFFDGRMMAPHITVWIVARGINLGLHTRMYFSDEEAANAEDPVLARIEHKHRIATLIAPRNGRYLCLRHPSAGRQRDSVLRHMIAAFDHPFLSGLLGDEEMSALLGADAEIAAMLRFERSLAEVEGAFGIVPLATANVIGNALKHFKPDMVALKRGVVRDGVVVPALVEQIRRLVGDPHAQYVHFGATSQDVIDTALILRVRSCLDLLKKRLNGLVTALDDIEVRFGDRTIIGRTRMQPAMPITVADRIESWRAPLSRHLTRLAALRKTILVVQFGGAAGTLDALDAAGSNVRAALATSLGLGDARQWQSQRDRIADLANWLSLVTGSLGKLGQDIALMAQEGDIGLAGGGRSSAMPHKQNPIDAELLVAMARFSGTLLSGIHQALIHEQERSGAAWTLEWLILPQMLMAAGASTAATARLLGNIRSIGLSTSPTQN